MMILAHLGQELDGFWHGLVHPLTGTDHLLAMLAVGVLAAVVSQSDRRVAWATPLAFVGGMLLGGVAGIAGIAWAPIETVIAVSIVVLAALIGLSAMGRLNDGVWLPVVALGFGAAHGIAHGGEVPSSASALTYVIGFVAATVALHVTGVLLGSTAGRHVAVRTGIAGVLSAAGVAILLGAPI